GVKVVGRRPGRTDDDGNGPRLPWPRHEPVARGDGTLEHAADIQRDSLVRLEDELASQGVDPAIERRPSLDLVPDLGREDEGKPASPAHARDGAQDERNALRAGLVSDVDRGRDLHGTFGQDQEARARVHTRRVPEALAFPNTEAVGRAGSETQ